MRYAYTTPLTLYVLNMLMHLQLVHNQLIIHANV